jgi:hypothetical protein
VCFVVVVEKVGVVAPVIGTMRVDARRLPFCGGLVRARACSRSTRASA